MANQTVTTSVNYDAASISGLLDGETITVNSGGVLTINSDVRWNQQAAVMGGITLNGSGSFLVDGTTVWEIPFTTSSGTVPTQAALGSNGVTGATSGATGELLRVFDSASPPAPVASGAAFPASGFIKLRTRTGNFQAGEVINLTGGATITATNAGRRSWLHLVGAENGFFGNTGTPTGTVNFIGDWYELGTTNGADDQIFQFPVGDNCPAIWIETAAGSGVYEPWLCAGDRWGTSTQYVPTTGERGKWFGIDRATGIITIARRATNACGTKPATGCKVRIGNVITSNSPSPYTSFSFPTDPNNRYRVQSIACPTYVSKMTTSWYFNLGGATIEDTSINGNFAAANNCTRVAVGIYGSSQQTSSATSGLAGFSWTDVRIGIFASTFRAVYLVSCNNFTFTRVRVDTFGTAGSTIRTVSPFNNGIEFLNCNNLSVNDISAIGTGLTINGCTSYSVKNHKYADLMIGTTSTSQAQSALTVTGNCINGLIEGFSAFDNLANVHPRTSVYAVGGYRNLTIQNIASALAPYDCGTVNPTLNIASVSPGENLTMRRCYFINPSTGNISIASGATYGTQLINVWGNGGLSTGANQIQGAIIRGCRMATFQATPGQAYGFFINDTLANDSVGYLEAFPYYASPSSSVGANQMTQTGTYLKNVGDTMTIEWDYFSLGHTGLTSVVTNYSSTQVDFQFDKGSGWNGTWLAATTANAVAVGAIDPAVGIKLKVRITALAANTTLQVVRFVTSTTAAAARTQYPLPGSSLTVNGLVPQSRVKVSRVDTGEVLVAQSVGASTSITFDIAYSGAVRVEARNASASTTYKPWVTQTTISSSTATTVTALQEID